ncbi:MAG: UDP-N-acetylglucosamine 1-carboxyvinyltransferase, partial [Bacteroidia bacterium]
MGSFKIEGGHRLKGELIPQGAKNEALQVISAVLLTPEEIVIENIPDIRDVNKLIDLLAGLGVKVENRGDGTFSFTAADINLEYLISEEFKSKGAGLRGSIMIVGPLLARFGKGYIPQPGGDKIGRRRLDTHFIGFQKLGAKFDYDPENAFFKVESSNLQGCDMLLDEASVTGTANIVMAAALANGRTTIYNAACEPYIQQLCKMINRMGGKISGISSNLLTIDGVDSLGGTNHRLLPDMIEIGSF